MKTQRNIAYFFLLIALILLIREYRKSPAAENNAVLDVAENVVTGERARSFSVYADSGAFQLVESRRNAITVAVQNSMPAVVGISVKATQRVPVFQDSFYRRFFGDIMREQQVSGLGSGFIVSNDGYIITNDHVVEAATEIRVTLPGGESYLAEKVHSDRLTDIALLKIDGENLPTVNLGNSDDIYLGEWVIAMGNPFGLSDMNNKPIVTVGVISATEQNFGMDGNNRIYEDMIQTDASINHGNSGGPLINGSGEVIGMNTFIFTGGTGEGNIGLGFAIPINKIMEIVNELQTKGEIERANYTGLSIANITRYLARRLNLRTTNGAIVSGVDKNSPAERAGLQVADVIIQIFDRQIRSAPDATRAFKERGLRPGDTVPMTIIRNGQAYSLTMTVERKE